MILFGLFQKTVLADNFGGIVESIQGMVATKAPLPAGMGLIFTYAFAFQIYCDFAAYSTIARGVARLFGVDLMRNFLTPYFSTNPSEILDPLAYLVVDLVAGLSLHTVRRQQARPTHHPA